MTVEELVRALRERHEAEGSPALHPLTAECFSHEVREEAVAYMEFCLRHQDDLADLVAWVRGYNRAGDDHPVLSRILASLDGRAS